MRHDAQDIHPSLLDVFVEVVNMGDQPVFVAGYIEDRTESLRPS
jgi:hypothetical protein